VEEEEKKGPSPLREWDKVGGGERERGSFRGEYFSLSFPLLFGLVLSTLREKEKGIRALATLGNGWESFSWQNGKDPLSASSSHVNCVVVPHRVAL